MTDKNLKILSGMRIDPLEPRPNYNVCLGNRGGRIMTEKIFGKARQRRNRVQSLYENCGGDER